MKKIEQVYRLSIKCPISLKGKERLDFSPQGWYLIADPIITANWSAKKSSDRWTIPIGGGVGKLFKIGNQPINSRIEAYYFIEKPNNAPDWQTVFMFQFLFPK